MRLRRFAASASVTSVALYAIGFYFAFVGAKFAA
jgi:hypothetical protein